MDDSGRRWGVYLLRCADGTFYCGVTNDLEARLHAHNHTKSGARYTRGRRPVTVAGYTGTVLAREDAQRLERQIKQLPRAEKLPFLLTAAQAANVPPPNAE